jgi:hypothetical protein
VFPSNHVAAVVVVYGFLAFLLARRVGTLVGVFVVTATTVVVVGVSLSGLYFGRFWFSDAIGGAALASVWVSVVAFTAVWRRPVVQPSRGFMPVLILTVVCVSVGVQLDAGTPAPKPDSAPGNGPVIVTTSQWTDSLWQRLPCYRSDMEGDRKEPLAIQWSGNIEEIGSRLQALGWVDGAELSARSLLSLASPKVSAMALPVLPELNNGVPSLLVFTHSGNARDERDVLRFWPTDYAIEEQGAASAAPVWLGSLVHERLYRESWPINMLRAVDPATATLTVHDQLFALPGVAVLAEKDCHGSPVTLLTSRSD